MRVMRDFYALSSIRYIVGKGVLILPSFFFWPFIRPKRAEEKKGPLNPNLLIDNCLFPIGQRFW